MNNINKKEMQLINELPVCFLISGIGRTGNHYFMGLLDSHPEVLMINYETLFYNLWKNFNWKTEKNIDIFTDNFFKETRLKYLIEGSFFGGWFRKPVDYSKINTKILINSFKKYLKNFGINRKNVFLSFFYAYAKSVNMNFNKLKIIVERTEIDAFYDCFEDFPDAKFITVIRDPRGNYSSYKQYWLAQTGDLILKNKKSVIIQVIKHFGRRYKLLKNILNVVNKEKYLILKLEDLHLNLIKTMENVSYYLSINFYDELMTKSTIMGKEWEGNSGFGKTVKTADKRVVNRWKNKITKGEKKIIEIFFKEEIIKYNFHNLTPFLKKKL